jgi:exosome complex component RRP43
MAYAAPIQPTAPTGLSPQENEALQASIFQRLHPRAYLERFLAEGFRPDGRTLEGWRDVSVNTGAFIPYN